MTALREKDPVTGNDENREPTILLSERAISSFVGFKPAPPNALEIATFPKTAMIGTTTIDGPSSATYIQENSYLHFLILLRDLCSFTMSGKVWCTSVPFAPGISVSKFGKPIRGNPLFTEPVSMNGCGPDCCAE